MIFHKKIEKIYKSMMFARYDDLGVVKYFSYKDFPGLNADPYTFRSSLGHTMQGYFYWYEGANTERTVIFEHGLGGGHRSYMKEIQKLCSAGYRVFAYDHTGCMESGGEGARGFSQSLHDLDDCLKALKSDKSINTSDISVIGHSWGGFSALNIPAIHSDVKKIAVLCGFVSVEKMIGQNFHGILKGYRKNILKLEKESNPDYWYYDSVNTLKNSDVKALLIYSDNDPIVHKKIHYDALFSALNGKENIKFMLVSGKGHNPNYTADAVLYLNVLAQRTKKEMKMLNTKQKKEIFKNSFDWDRMTAQDEKVWENILGFLSNNNAQYEK